MFALHAKKVTVRGIIREFWLYLFTFQPDKSAQLFIEGIWALSRSPNDETSNIRYTCFQHYVILDETRRRRTTAIAFSRQIDAGSRARLRI